MGAALDAIGAGCLIMLVKAVGMGAELNQPGINHNLTHIPGKEGGTFFLNKRDDQRDSSLAVVFF